MSVTFSGPALAGALVLAMAGASFGQIISPANLPPAGFKGQQFIDSKGCIFVRAGFGGQVNWVPRLDARKRPICTGPEVAVTEAPMAPPVVAAPPAVAAPQARAQGGGFLAFLFAPGPQAAAPQAPQVVAPAPEVSVTFSNPQRRSLPTPPPGWKQAWKDDRLNPLRGIGTSEGQAQQNRVYSQTVPMVALADLSAAERAKVEKRAATRAARVTVSTMSAPEAGGGAMIQVGCFGQDANARAASARIAGLGLPVALSTAKGLQVVMAGPLAPGEAAAALQTLRASGFPDAFLR